MHRFAGETFFENQIFDAVDASATLRDCEFFRCTFRQAKWSEATIERCTFEDCTFEDSDLTRVNTRHTSLRGVRFLQCKLLGVDFSRLAANPDMQCNGCSLRYAIANGVNWRGVQLLDCDLSEAQFVDVNFIDADFSASKLMAASFQRCDLRGANFSQTTGVYFDPRSNNAKAALVPVEMAVLLAQSAGLLVHGYDEVPKRKPKR